MDDTLKRLKENRLYCCDDPEFIGSHDEAQDKLHKFNMISPKDVEARKKFYEDFFGSVGENLTIEGRMNISWGKNTYWGNNCYANFNLTIIDDIEVNIGDYVLFGPNVTITTTGHAIQPELRKKTAQFSLPVNIGNNVWVGAGCIILPGVTIGDNSVIGAGSVVTKDIPANCVAYGTPCKKVRDIDEHDDKYYFRDMKVDMEF